MSEPSTPLSATLRDADQRTALVSELKFSHHYCHSLSANIALPSKFGIN